MLIAISSTGENAASRVDPRFGRCNYFAIYNTQDNSFRFIANKAAAAGGGAGIAAAQQVLDEDVEAIITGNMGPNSYNVIVSAGIPIYRAGDVSLEAAVQLFREAKLDAIATAGAAHFGMRRGGPGGF